MIDKLLASTENLWLRRLLVAVVALPLAVLLFVVLIGVCTLPQALWSGLKGALVAVLEAFADWADPMVYSMASWAKVSARHWKAREVE